MTRKKKVAVSKLRKLLFKKELAVKGLKLGALFCKDYAEAGSDCLQIFPHFCIFGKVSWLKQSPKLF